MTSHGVRATTVYLAFAIAVCWRADIVPKMFVVGIYTQQAYNPGQLSVQRRTMIYKVKIANSV